MQHTLTALAVCSILAACASVPEAANPQVPGKVPVLDSIPVPITAPIASAQEMEAKRLQRIIKMLADRSIYFDYDAFTVKPEYQDLLREDYEALKSAPNLAIHLEGNTDEHGSTEYNLALGQKRAEAVKHSLQLLGLAEDRVEATSNGKEKPRASCHEEQCWAKNRRVDIVVNGVGASR